jgi:hypothetical protein
MDAVVNDGLMRLGKRAGRKQGLLKGPFVFPVCRVLVSGLADVVFGPGLNGLGPFAGCFKK